MTEKSGLFDKRMCVGEEGREKEVEKRSLGTRHYIQLEMMVSACKTERLCGLGGLGLDLGSKGEGKARGEKGGSPLVGTVVCAKGNFD